MSLSGDDAAIKKVLLVFNDKETSNFTLASLGMGVGEMKCGDSQRP